MTLLDQDLLSDRYLMVPGLVTISLTVDPNATAPVTYQVSGVRKRPLRQSPMTGGPFFSEVVDVVFTIPRATLPAGLEPVGGMLITETSGRRWSVQDNSVRLLGQYYKVGCTELKRTNEFVPPPPPSSGGDPEEPPGPVPTVEITAVSPDPRASAVSAITIVFNKPVTGFDLADLTLTRNAGANLLTGSQTLTTSDNQTWTLGNLAGLTGTNGTYLLTVVAASSGIVDQSGQALVDNDTEQWVMNSSLFTASITAVSPDPRNSAVSSITIVFSAAVDSGFTIADLSLTRNGGSNLLTGSQTLTTSDNITWTLGNLSGLTATSGTYLLTLTASGSSIVDGSANALSGDATETWTTDATAPTATITPVTADPRTEPVASVQVVFSEAVTGVTAGAFTLSRDGSANLLVGGQSVTTSDNLTWTLHGLTAVSATAGSYTLTLNGTGAGIADLAGNALTGSVSDSWVCVAPSLIALPLTDDRTEAGMYQTSKFLNGPGPWPHKWCGLVISYDQANILPAEVLTGLPDGVTKLQANIDKFKAGAPQSLRFMEVTGAGILTEDIMNAYRGPSSPAGRYEGRGVFTPHGVIWNESTMAGKVRTDIPGPNLEAYAYMNYTTPSNRAFWAQAMIDHVEPWFEQFPDYQGLWMDEQSDKLIDINQAAIVDLAAGYWTPIRNWLRATGRLLSINLTTHCQFDDAAADAIVDSIDVLVIEKMFAKGQMNTTQFPITLSRLRRMYARNPGGFGIFDLQGVDFADSNRECTIIAAANAPGGGMRITCSSPHYLDNTANKAVSIRSLTPFGVGSTPNYFNTPVKVTDMVFDLPTAGSLGTLSPTGSSAARFVESDLEVGMALNMIARQQAGRPFYMYWVPGGPQYDPYRWPTLYGQPAGDYTIVSTSGTSITKLTCNFSGGTLGAHRVTVEPQAARRAYWEPI